METTAIPANPIVPPAPTLEFQTAYSYAGFWRRVLASFIDGVLLSIVMKLFLQPIITQFSPAPAPSIEPTSFALVVAFGAILLQFIASLAYFSLLESSSHQATIGKMVVGVKVTDLQGHRISILRAMGRHLAKILSGLILCIGYLMVAFTAKKQGLHDIIAGTLVLKKGTMAVQK